MANCLFHTSLYRNIGSLFFCLLVVNELIFVSNGKDLPKLELVSPRIRKNSFKCDPGKRCLDIKSGSNLHLKCISNRPVLWAFPQNHYEDSRNIGLLAKMEDKCEIGFCESNFILKNTSFEQTGFYACLYNDTGFEVTADNSDSIYIFVNDEENLLVPVEGNPSIRVLIVETYPATIPCLPTISTTNVTLIDVDTLSEVQFGDNSTIFDVTQGFFFKNPKNSGHYSEMLLKCIAEYNGKTNDMYVHVMWSYKPIGLTPIIKDDDAKNVRINSTFALVCLVHIEIGSIIKLDWVIPTKTISRAFEDNLKTEILDENFQTVSKRLTVMNAQPEDDGLYVCQVTDTTKVTYVARHNITVSTSQGEQRQVLNFTVDLNDFMLKVNVGEEAKFVITAHGVTDILSLRISWWKDGSKMNLNPIREGLSKPRSVGRIQSEIDSLNNQIFLIINNVEMQDTGKYTLFGKVGESQKPAEISMRLMVIGKPYVSIESRSFYKKDEEYSLSCLVIATPQPKIQWLWFPCSTHLLNCRSTNTSNWLPVEQRVSSNNETVYLSQNSTFGDGGKFVSSLNLTARESGIYRCAADNENGTTTKEELFVVSDINENGFSLTSSTNETVEKEEFFIICKASAFVYSTVSWYIKNKNSTVQSLNTNSTRIEVHEGQTKLTMVTQLIFKPLLQKDNASYFCNATSMDNIVRKSRSEEYILAVDSAVAAGILRTNMRGKIITAMQSTMISFSCEVAGKPTPKIVWLKNGKPMNTSAPGFDLLDKGQKLVIRRLVVLDSGRYECQVSNRLKSVSSSVTLKVKGNDSGMSAGSIVGGVIFTVVGVVFVILAIILGKRIREERKKSREIGFITQNLLEHGALEFYNDDLPLDEQAELLPYEQRYEFPRERLKLGRTLGQGAFGRVVRAEAIGLEEGETSTTVAVKMLKERADFNQMKALVAELKIMIHLGRHLNIVNLLGAVTRNLDKGELMVLVEYCRCGNLREYLLARREYFVNQINPETGEVENKPLDSMINNNTEETAETKTETVESPDYENIAGIETVTNPGYQMCSNSSPVIDYVNCVVVKSKPIEENSITINETSSPSVSFRRQFSAKSHSESSRRQKKKVVTTYDLICFGFQVARGMEYLERRKLIHRDLAARNVLLADDNIVKICDFGLAKDCYKYDEYVKKGDGPLPIKWMAIESIRDKVFTHKSDVWSFGIMLWEFFTLGSNPYPGIEVNEEFYKKLKYGYRMEKPDYSPDNIYKIMQDCWLEDPNQRPNFTELAELLGDLLESSVRQHYVDLNDPYQQMNINRQSEYLLMKRESTKESEDYLQMDQNDYESMVTLKSKRPIEQSYVNCAPIIELQDLQRKSKDSEADRSVAIDYSNSDYKIPNNQNTSNASLDYLSMNDSNSSFPPIYRQLVR